MSDAFDAPISAIVSNAIPKNTPTISSVAELPDTHFNTFFSIALTSPSSQKSVILKLAPPLDIRLLRCDRALASAEVALLRLIQRSTTVPVPSVIGYDASGDLIGSPYLLLSTLPGASLSSIPPPLPLEAARIAGSHTRTLSAIKHPSHGYGQAAHNSPIFQSWRAAFLSLFDGLITDAEEALVQLPYGAIRTQLRRLCVALDAVKKPRLSLLDFDARKVLVDQHSDGEAKITGLLGFGRALWGDPLMARWFRNWRTEEGRAFMLGYFGDEKAADAEMMNWKTRARLLLYDMFHCVHIILERYYYGLRAELEMTERMRLVRCLEALTKFKAEDGMSTAESVENS